jgi:hypothetical protein
VRERKQRPERVLLARRAHDDQEKGRDDRHAAAQAVAGRRVRLVRLCTQGEPKPVRNSLPAGANALCGIPKQVRSCPPFILRRQGTCRDIQHC